jgi:hypothetical protein
MKEDIMLKNIVWLKLLVALLLGFLFGCMEFGKVDQGRAVGFDKEKRILTMIRDKKNDSNNPDYSYLPPLTYTLPTDPMETGPEPKAGGLMKLDVDKHQIIIFDPKAQSFKTIDFKLIEKKEGVGLQDPAIKGKTLPMIEKDNKTITIYSGRQKILLTISVPEEYLALQPSTWDAGDEVRIYYKEEGKALRFMNISKTDIFKK